MYILGVSGKDSATAALITKLHYPEIWAQTTLFWSMTGADYPCVYEWIDRVEAYLERPINRVDGRLHERIQAYTNSEKAFLPSRTARYCTKEAKIQPMERWVRLLECDRVTLITGMRFDEQQRVGYNPSAVIQSQWHPLIERRIALGQVYAILEAVNLMPPDFFWPTLYQATLAEWAKRFPLIEMRVTTHQRRMLFSGRTRTNCYFCFNQRLYEWLWLAETYPELFAQAKAYEKDSYSWNQGESLDEILARKEQIIRNRALFNVRQIQRLMFNTPLEQEDDLYDSPACGLFCGK